MIYRTRQVIDDKNEVAGWLIFCPACMEAHFLNLGYEFNDDYAAPTFNPFVLVKLGEFNHRCRSWIRAGFIIYEEDCSHPFKGRTLELPEFKDG